MTAALDLGPPQPAVPHPQAGRVAELRDRLAASDPGLGRLRQALSAVTAMGSALAVESGLARLLGQAPQSALVTMLLGAVVAMMGSNALVGSEVWGKVKTAVFFPVAVGSGMVLGTLTSTIEPLRVAGFVVVMFAAVYVRRFGTPWFFYGFMAWMGYFFISFLGATLAMLPALLLAVTVASVWVLLLSITIFRTNPRTALQQILHAFFARGRSVARECADLLDERAATQGRHQVPRGRALGALAARQAGLAEAALMAEAWSEDERSLPPGWSGPALRRRMLEAQQAIERMARATAALEPADPEISAEARRVLHHVAQRRDEVALVAVERLRALSDRGKDEGLAGWWPARHLAVGARDFLELDADVDRPPVVEDVDTDFEATAQLVFGNLPGAPAVARDVRVRGASWNPMTRLDMPTRQAVQVALAGALAIALGTALSPTRYYWAVIAAFVTFTGTGTRAETFLKGANRILGTLVGLVGAILLAHVTVGHTPWIIATILLCVFLGFYLIRVSYAYMIFFITIMLGQLYTVLGTFSDSLLALRLGETVIGALAGVAVALVVAPLSTRDTVRSARDALLGGLSDVLEGLAAYVEGERVDLDALARLLDDHARRLFLVAKPLTRPLVIGNHSARTRHRLALYSGTVAQSRALVLSLQRHRPEDPSTIAAAARALAEAARRITEVTPGRTAETAEEPLNRGDATLFGLLDAADGRRSEDPVVRHLHHLNANLADLAERPLAPTPEPVLRPGPT